MSHLVQVLDGVDLSCRPNCIVLARVLAVEVVGRRGPTSTWGSLLVAQLHCCAGCDIVQVMTSGGPDFAENCLTTQCVAMNYQVTPKSTTNISMQQQL